MTDVSDFRKSDQWVLFGKRFNVVVKHWQEEPLPPDCSWGREDGRHRWGVYGYIFKGHAIFDTIEIHKAWPYTDAPLHAGMSWWDVKRDVNMNVSVFEIGADYNHLGDDHHSWHATADDAGEVFRDARALHAWLETATSLESP